MCYQNFLQKKNHALNNFEEIYQIEEELSNTPIEAIKLNFNVDPNL